jgi:hypothetical protein
MVITAIGGDFVVPPDSGCWCCGDQTVSASVVRLSAHPEVGVCFRCLGYLNGRRERSNERVAGRHPVRGGDACSTAPASTAAEVWAWRLRAPSAAVLSC